MDALITVTGKQRNLGENEPDVIEITARGKFYERNGVYYIFYDEKMEQFDEVLHSSIKIDRQANTVEIGKKGPIQNQMLFELGKKTNSMYRTEFGILEMGMDTDMLQLNIKEDRFYMELHYMMEVNCQLVGENTVIVSAIV